MAIYSNLPGIFLDALDGQLTVYPDAGKPKFLILGTSDKEPENADGTPFTYPYTVTNFGAVKQAFGTEGTLYNTMAEANTGGASNFLLWRVGSSTSTKIEIYEELFKAYAYMYDQPLDGVIPGGVYLDDKNVMDGDSDVNGTSLGRFAAREVDGKWQTAWWFPSDPSDLAGSVFTAATYTDEAAADMTTSGYNSLTGILTYAAVTNLAKWSTFNAAGTAASVVFGNTTETFTEKSTLNNLDTLADYHISSTGVVSVFAGKGLADAAAAENALTDTDANALTVAFSYQSAGIIDRNRLVTGQSLDRDDFHEVNFAYQLAEFCHRGSEVVDMRMGFIGVNPASNWGGAAAQAIWVGKAPTLNADGSVTANGTGLLGNKFLSGRVAAGTVPAFKNTAGYNGHGGFFACAEDTDTNRCFLDGIEKLDANNAKVDIGKYLNIVASWISYAGSGGSYECSAAAAYGGFAQGGNLPVASATTNKLMPSGVNTLLGTVTALKMDALAGKRVVGLLNKATGVVVSDGPTAATPASDYARLSTMRQVEACVDGIRRVGEPFLGEGMTGAEIAALNTAISGALGALVKDGSISSFVHQVVVTPQMKILGQAIVQLKIVPAFELRQITVVVGLSAT